jgi:hypothetical protein
MTKTHLENTKPDERWRGNDKKTMSTKNGEIATNNNSKEGYQKATLKAPLQVPSWIGIFVFEAKGVTRETLKAPKMILKDTKGTKYTEDVGGTVVENVFCSVYF